MALPTHTDVLIVGAGPAGSTAAAWAARFGMDVVLADAATFPRDKTCGDGLTPRAIAELERLGLGDWVRGHGTNRGLRAAGFGQELLLPWPGGSLPDYGSAVPRTELDDKLFRVAVDAGATPFEGARAVDATRDAAGRVTAVTFQVGKDRTPHTVTCNRLVVADGVRSPLGRVLGREWHRDTVYGVAGRSYLTSGRSDDPWISSHLELRGEDDELLPGYGWIFPLSDGEVNLGVGALATAKRPADLQIRPLGRSLIRNRALANEHEAFVFLGNGGMDLDLILEPDNFLPYDPTGYRTYALLWSNWFQHRSPSEEPPAPVKTAFELYRKVQSSPDAKVQGEAIKEIVRISGEQFFNIGISLPPSGYGIISNTMRNVPKSIVDIGTTPYIGLVNPEQFFKAR